MDNATKNKTMQFLWDSSCLDGGNAEYLEELFEHFLQDPHSVDVRWRQYFETLPYEGGVRHDVPHSAVRESFRQMARQKPVSIKAQVTTPVSTDHTIKQMNVQKLIDAYRFIGHLQANLDPLKLACEKPDDSGLRPENYGLTAADYETVFDAGSIAGLTKTSLKEIIDTFNNIYCNSIGSEYMHITESSERMWIQGRLEKGISTLQYGKKEQGHLLDLLTAAEGMERYLHTKYVGQKRFSLEGAESLIPLLDVLIQRGGTTGLKEIVIGMAHRGRLNVLVNIMGKMPKELFMEFEGKKAIGNGTGDVKYHMGFSSDIKTPGGPVHLALAFNPSHLEIVGPVVEGSVRARQDRRNDIQGNQSLSILIHGDAAFAGQGVVMETLNMSQSSGYSTRGTVHVVINNQIGFTTSNLKDARSTLYCTDVAKMVNAPIFHVNGDDPEAVLFVSQLALDYRMTFHKDVVIDLVCYRRHGHSEADEPNATQPIMYQKIKTLPTTRALYAQKLQHDGVISSDVENSLVEGYRGALEVGDSVVLETIKHDGSDFQYTFDWTPFLDNKFNQNVKTTITLDQIRKLSDPLTRLPEGFRAHTNVEKILDNRRKMAAGALPIDWGYAENLAYASIVYDKYAVRLSGQDCGRGTFFHRHAVIYNQKDGVAYVPLCHIAKDQKTFLVINSLLSEEAVLAFEYGYATTDPDTLVIWEAQFGDFANNAQVVIDQFISAGEQKWGRMCGLVMLLPHGFEGQGPEHSSARLERYLQLCAQHNMQVCVPSTPAQIFHLLRRQMLMSCRRPLIVMTPKSLLRHRLAVSTLEDLSEGGFQVVIPEIDELDENGIKRVILCSGKIYYDLLEKRRKDERNDVAIIRMEQLYPFPKNRFKEEVARYKNAEIFIWCQEEPKNQGAWYASQHHMRTLLGEEKLLQYAGRPLSAAPAVGYPSLHVQQLHALLDEALG